METLSSSDSSCDERHDCCVAVLVLVSVELFGSICDPLSVVLKPGHGSHSVGSMNRRVPGMMIFDFHTLYFFFLFLLVSVPNHREST